MSVPQKRSPLFSDLDTDELRIGDNKARLLKNLLFNVNKNANAAAGEGENFGVNTPLESNALLTGSLTMPAGQNYCCGYKESIETNEGFVFVYNSQQNHFIYSVNGADGSCQIVYKGKWLYFKYGPEYFINDTRCVVRVVPYIDPQTGLEARRTFILFVDGENDHRFICKEDSIATNSFTGAFFMPLNVPAGEIDTAVAQYISLGKEQSLHCVKIETIQPTEPDTLRQNLLVDKGWQFRIKFIDVYGRESEHGVISDRFFLATGNNCIKNSSGLPRCLNLTFYAGNPFVNKLQIEYRTCSLNVTDLSVDSGWQVCDVLDKYEYSVLPWYQRSINPDINFDAGENTFEYIFCADKLSTLIDQDETNRLYNPLPLTSDTIFSLNEGIGLGNNVRDFEPIAQDLTDLISFNVIRPTEGICPNIVPKKITVYAMLWNPYTGENTRIWYNTDTSLYFFQSTIDLGPHGMAEGGQTFPKGITGFTGYLAGTSYVTISKQVIIYADDNTEGSIDAIDRSRPFVIAHKFEFIVLPGKYIFRIASHLVKPNENYQATSTFTAGTTILNSTLTDFGKLSSILKEKIVDVCTDDFRDPINLLMIHDLVANDIGTVYGYLYESELERTPIELAGFVYVRTDQPKISMSTDHNGFYYATMYALGDDLIYSVDVSYNDCVINHNIVANGSIPQSSVGYQQKDLFVYHQQDKYPDIGRRYIRGRIYECGNVLVGLPGIPVLLANGMWVRTDNDGRFTIIAHNRRHLSTGPDGLDVDWPTIADKVIISQGGVCQLISCSDCEMCFPDYTVAYVACNGSVRTTDVGTLQALIRGANQAGPQNGGRYGLGYTLHDWQGRPGFVQANDTHFVDIPSLLELQSYVFTKIGFQIGAGFQAPAWAKYLTFWITPNLNWEDSITWAIDRVAFVDTTGNENAANPIKIRLYYESIAEYSAQNNFSTNSVWQFLDASDGVVLGDRVEFLQKPDGTWFDKMINGLVRYDKDGRYIEIDYDEDLRNLEDGTLVKLIRPKQIVDNNLYFELCPVIPIVNGEPMITSGTFNYFDSYFLNRSIPVPFYTANATDPTKQDRNVIARTYTYFYEHHSPSDFWGDHCRTRGRINVKNPYERQKRLGSEVALSKALLTKSNFNGLSYFDVVDITPFDEQQWGPITGVIVEKTTVLVICGHANFIVGFNDVNARTDINGNVIAPSRPNKFGTPQRKLGSNYGCLKRDICTIQKLDGTVIFLDSTKASLVFNAFTSEDDISKGTGAQSWVERSVSIVKQQLLDTVFPYTPYFVGGIDPKNGEYYLTKFYARNFNSIAQPTLSYINTQLDVNLSLCETVVYNIATGLPKAFKGMVSFTPEFYGTLEGYYKGNNMLVFRLGQAWSQHENDPSSGYNKFFGVQCKKSMELITNLQPEKEKRFLATEVYCREHLFIADRVKTESGQLSRILAPHWEKRDTFYCAPYLCNILTPADPVRPVETGANAILDGDTLYGRWLTTRYISRDQDDAKYCEVSAVIAYVIASEKSGQ